MLIYYLLYLHLIRVIYKNKNNKVCLYNIPYLGVTLGIGLLQWFPLSCVLFYSGPQMTSYHAYIVHPSCFLSSALPISVSWMPFCHSLSRIIWPVHLYFYLSILFRISVSIVLLLTSELIEHLASFSLKVLVSEHVLHP